ncbi:hypothetical protein DPMN_034498 [Dreissena polymorpha]|uniref:Uncharacterized protein n=1 Tax=Dreissena polymorpha TaxID=45954 RepID=A0A9D4MAA0_DREPO|nr:hypothetical protein DPMN_034498 [Dreissena polymorpha]
MLSPAPISQYLHVVPSQHNTCLRSRQRERDQHFTFQSLSSFIKEYVGEET